MGMMSGWVIRLSCLHFRTCNTTGFSIGRRTTVESASSCVVPKCREQTNLPGTISAIGRYRPRASSFLKGAILEKSETLEPRHSLDEWRGFIFERDRSGRLGGSAEFGSNRPVAAFSLH